ncbi:MAG TPA: fructose PTS transporter subunit IIA, partial [Glycomyces sp.]
PLGQGLATLIRKRLYTEQERETGLASLFMGCFGISEGAIPFAAARPAQVIPANMLGGAVAGAIAGVAGVEDAVPHGGPIVAVLGAVSGVPMFFVAVVIGSVVTALTTVALVDLGERRRRGEAGVGLGVGAREAVLVGAGVGQGGVPRQVGRADAAGPDAVGPAGSVDAADPVGTAEVADETGSDGDSGDVLSGYLTERTVKVRLGAGDKEAAIREMAELLGRTGKVVDPDELVATALRREEQGTTGLGEEIAIPHAKTDAVSAPVVGFARSVEGVEWGSPDGTKARLVFMIAVPEAAAGDEHLRILALLSRKLMDAEFRERLLAAPDESAVLGVLREVG